MAVASVGNFIEALRNLPLLTPEQKAQLPALQRRLPDLKALAQELIKRGWLTSWQAQQLSQGRAADVRLGSYLLLEPIGNGGNGQVFKARHDKMNRLVAVKMLRPDLAHDRETVQRFHREIEVIGQLSHPNIVHALEAGPIGSVLVLVTEYVEGRDLEQLVRQSGPLPALEACDYMRQAACGLAHAHERGLVHRDIKPSNLILSQSRTHGDGVETIKHGPVPATIKILDLGLARLQQPVQGSTTGNLTVLGGNAVTHGTPDYMSPEQALDFHSADSRADLYSLGCTLYFLLVGQPPFPGGSLAEKLMKHQQAKPPSIERNDLSAGLLVILAKLLAKRPADRYQTPAELAQALTDLLSKDKAASAVTSIVARPHRHTEIAPRRRRLVVGVAGSLALAGLLGACAVLFRGPGSSSITAAGVLSQGSSQPPMPSADLVKDISTSNKKAYTTTTAQVGAVCYIDRGYKILALGQSLQGGTLIRTANDDKGDRSGAFLSFALAEPAVIFVVADCLYTRLPAWLDGSTWQLTPETVTFEGQGRAYKVYRKQFAAGPVTLGGGGQAPASGVGGNYVVIVQPAR